MLAVLSRIPVNAQKQVRRGLLVAAGLCLVCAVFSLLIMTDPPPQKCTGHLWAKKCVDLPKSHTPVIVAVVLAAVVLFCLTAALMLTVAQARLKKYLPILKGIESMPVQRIMDITGSSRATVYRDLWALINSHVVDDVYVDYTADQVVNKRYIPEASRKTVVKCTECDGNNELIVGIPKACTFCGQPLLLGTN